MRRLIEAVKGMEVDTMDGIKVSEDGGWVQLLPDPEEPSSTSGRRAPTGRNPCGWSRSTGTCSKDRVAEKAGANPQLELEEDPVTG